MIPPLKLRIWAVNRVTLHKSAVGKQRNTDLIRAMSGECLQRRGMQKHQMSFSQAVYAKKKKTTRREVFLERMEHVVFVVTTRRGH